MKRCNEICNLGTSNVLPGVVLYTKKRERGKRKFLIKVKRKFARIQNKTLYHLLSFPPFEVLQILAPDDPEQSEINDVYLLEVVSEVVYGELWSMNENVWTYRQEEHI